MDILNWFRRRWRSRNAVAASPETLALAIMQVTLQALGDVCKARQDTGVEIDDSMAVEFFPEIFVYYFSLFSLNIVLALPSEDARNDFGGRVLLRCRTFAEQENDLPSAIRAWFGSEQFAQAFDSRFRYYMKDTLTERERARLERTKRILHHDSESGQLEMTAKLIARLWSLVDPSESSSEHVLFVIHCNIHLTAGFVSLHKHVFGSIVPER